MIPALLLTIHPLATLNAVLNGLATCLLIAGWIFITRGNQKAHRTVMVAAFVVSAIFLVSYLTYHYLVGHVSFGGAGAVRAVYFAILVTHIVLAVVVPVLAIAMFILAWRGRWQQHRRLGKITLPIWLYVSITGVVIYFMVYHLYPMNANHNDDGDQLISELWQPELVGNGSLANFLRPFPHQASS